MTAKSSTFLVIFCLVAVGTGTPALSQSDSAPRKAGCVAPSVQQTPGQSGSRATDPDTTGSTDLSDCNGVIAPPVTNDNGMVQPAPKAGNTPILRPGDVPQQAPKAN